MILEKIKPVGIDVDIAIIQKAIHDAFDIKWSYGQNTSGGIICYPRCYINTKRRNKFNVYDSKIIEYFDSSNLDDSLEYTDINTEYSRDILDAENNKMIILAEYDIFPVNSMGNFESSIIECIFIVNLNKTHPEIKHRADEEVRLEVKQVFTKIPNTKIKRIVRTLGNVFGDIKYSTNLDMQPLHCFKIILELNRIGVNKICKY